MSSSNSFNLNSNIVLGTTLFGDEETFSIQSVSLPGITLSYEVIPSRYDVLNAKVADRKLDYNSLSMTVICDENMDVWSKMIRKILDMKQVDSTYDAWITITNSKNEVIKTVYYTSVLPVLVGDLQYSTTGENEEMVFDLELTYDYYTVKDDSYKVVLSLSDDVQNQQEPYTGDTSGVTPEE